jgi:hypothetical protein
MKLAPVLAAVSVIAACGAANAAVVVTFNYNDLSGNYTGDSTSGTFNAHAVDSSLHSAGSVARVVPTVGTADFQPGFASGGDSSDFVLNMTLGAISSNMRSGNGTFTATDADGDTLSGSLNGTWQQAGTFLSFAGSLSGVVFTDNGGQDGLFNGSSSGSFPFADLNPLNLSGAIIDLTANVAGGFFSSNFTDAASGVNGQIIPAPGALFGLGLIGLAGARRRR